MEVPTIEMERDEAAQALREYRAAVKEHAGKKRDEAERELARIDAAVMRGYRELARGSKLVELSKVIAAGGTVEVTWKGSRWNGKSHVPFEKTKSMPKLAACRSDSSFVFTQGIERDGSVTFRAGGSTRKADTIELPAGTFTETAMAWQAFRTMLPTIPPHLRPPHSLGNYVTLWEVESWETAKPPGDPALLKHLGGDLYALLAVWDLTPLERAVLAGERAHA